MALRIAPGGSGVGYNKTYAQNTDRLGGVLDWAKLLVAGGFWRWKAQGDGQSAVNTASTTTCLFSSNSGTGYTTSGQAWNTVIANSWYHPLAYFVIEELGPGGTPTGRQILCQRSSSSAAGNERLINIAFSWTGFTGTPTATAAPSTGTFQLLIGTAINGTGVQAFNDITAVAQCVIAGTASITYHFWDCDVLGGTTANVAPCAFVCYDSTNADLAGVSFMYEAFVEAAAADTHPCFCWAGTGWQQRIGESYTAVNGVSIFASSDANAVAYTSNTAGTVKKGAFNQEIWLGSSSSIVPVTNSLATYDADADGYRWLTPAIFYAETTSTTTVQPKGVAETIMRIRMPDNTADWPLQIKAADNNSYWISLNEIVMPWVTGFATPTGFANETSTGAWIRKRTQAVVDTTAPTITLSPAAGAVPYNQAFTVQCTDAVSGLAGYAVDIDFTTPDKHEFVGRVDNTGTFVAEDHYDAAATESNITNGKQLVFSRDNGLFAACTVNVWAVDNKGNKSAVLSQAYTLSSNNDATVGSVTPTASTTLAYGGSQAFTLTIPRGLKTNSCIVRAAYSGRTETVYAAGALQAPYVTSSTATSSPTTSLALSIVRDNGFPGSSVTFTWECVDNDGVRVSGTIAQTITGNAITAGSYSPANNTTVAYNGTIGFTLTVPQTIKTAIVRAVYSDRTETVYAAGARQAPYVTGSTATVAPTTSLALVLARDNGWRTSSVTLAWEVVDNENVKTTGTVTQSITGNGISAGSYSPANGSSHAYNAHCGFTLTVPQQIKEASAYVIFSDGTTETIYADGALQGAYTGGSATTAPTTSLAFDLVRTVGWRGDYVVHWAVVDQENVRTTGTVTHTISGTNPASPDTTAPTVTLVSPTAGANLGRKQPVTVQVSDNRALELCMLFVLFPEMSRADVVYDAQDPDLGTAYEVTDLGAGLFRITPRVGWPQSSSSPQPMIFRVRAIDTSGNMAA
jgi:hypothetical protein